MRVFSAIQPTGAIHIGNYLGAIKQWVPLQEKNECVFCIVDLHALTVPYNPEELPVLVKEKVAAYLAAGIDPEKSIIFLQSQIKEHTELCWLLNTVTPVGDLLRMTQYKEKAKKFSRDLNAGLLNYPVLMASDILLYQTKIVPVGEDQKQHVELARTIARKFNQKFGKVFEIPEAKISKSGAKIMSLSNPSKKMSKSDPKESHIGIFDEPNAIKKKIMSAVTDAGKEIKYDPKKKPGISNLLAIYSLLSEKEISEIEKEFKGKGYAVFKKGLSDLLIGSLSPFRKKREELLKREVYIAEILGRGAKKAGPIAETTLENVRRKMGLIQ